MAGYERIYWEDEPSTNTPLSAENLNRMDLGIANCASEGAELTEQMETTNARIDEIVALPDGSTTADAELVDIRVGAGGNTFNSAGTAVRTQIKRLASVSDTQPSDPSNRIWIKGDAEEVEIPTMAELNEVKADLVSDYAPIINASVEAKFTDIASLGIVSGTGLSAKVTGLGLDKMIAYDGSNILGDLTDLTVIQDWGSGSVTLSKDHITLTGTATKRVRFKKNGADSWNIGATLPKNTYVYFGAIIKGNSTGGGSNCRLGIIFYDSNGTQVMTSSAYLYDGSLWFRNNVKLSGEASKMAIEIQYGSGWSCDGLEVYPFFFLSSNYITNSTTIEVGADYPLDIPGWTKLSTAPYIHTLEYKADTKTYIDNHVPDDYISIENLPEYIPAEYVKESELIYITPEMFGAKGDGVEDDTTALQACINTAIVSAGTYKTVGVRGYGFYKTTQPIIISGRYQDIYLNWINYTGIDAAFVIRGGMSHYKFNRIAAESGETTVGIRIAPSTENNGIAYGYNYNDLSCGYIIARGNAIEFINNTTNTIFYDTFQFNDIYSHDGNAFYFDAVNINELDFYGKGLDIRNGYFIYNEQSGFPSLRFHHFGLEEDVKYGIHSNGVSLIECRTSEFQNHYKETDSKQGILFDFDGLIPAECGTDEKTIVKYICIDVSGALSFEDAVAKCKEQFEDGSYSNTTVWRNLYTYNNPVIFRSCREFSPSGAPGYTGSAIHANGSLIVYYNHIAYKPAWDWYHKITSATFSAGSQNNADFIVPTFFDIDTDTEIYLDWSYACIAINKFTIKQYADKKAVVYDKTGALLWDGSQAEAGTYIFECAFDRLDEFSITLDDETVKTMSASYCNRVYTGTNEVWHSYKVNNAT